MRSVENLLSLMETNKMNLQMWQQAVKFSYIAIKLFEKLLLNETDEKISLTRPYSGHKATPLTCL